jgi:hypothetical protein
MRAAASPKPDCPSAPPSRRTIALRAIHRACILLGGAAQLAAHLNVAEPLVRNWLDGELEPPESAFLAAVEILLLGAEGSAGRAS